MVPKCSSRHFILDLMFERSLFLNWRKTHFLKEKKIFLFIMEVLIFFCVSSF